MRYRVPGVFLAPESEQIAPIAISKQCLAGLIGIAEKGPLDTPVRVSSFQQYQKIFGGFTEYGYLPYAVYGFFNAGGTECVVVRVAHTSDDENDQYAISEAYYNVLNTDGEEAFRITAKSPGSWGNKILVKLWYKTAGASHVKSDVSAGDDSLLVEDSGIFSVGDSVEIRSPDRCEYKQIVRIDGNRVYFFNKIEKNYDTSPGDVICNLCGVNIVLQCGGTIEEYYLCSARIDDEMYFVNRINESSQLVHIVQLKPGSLPVELNNRALIEGRNGVLNITPKDFIGRFKGLDDKKGLGIFESIDEISIMAAPDVLIFEEVVHKDKNKALDDIFTVQKAMVEQCEILKNRFAILDMPEIRDGLKSIKWAGRFDTDSAAMYFPRIEIINPADSSGLSSVFVPPSGHISGLFAETDRLEGKHRAPANKYIKGAVGVSYHVDNDEYEMLYPHGINNLRYVPGRGIKVWGARTLSNDSEWKYINVRRAFSAISRAIEQGTGWAVFESNDRNLRKRIIRHITAFLINLFREGYLAGTVPEEAFYIRCDDELNPGENIDLGIITVEIGIAIARPAEFLVVMLKTDLDNQAVVSAEV
ncbi:MAG: phage tail sheath subtilisin-like domain-containing protein [Spirochaetes bacterium]|nr:phage tail sheath subtilisin-like domain-containing protein [Spirochaetota bacterium]